MRRSGSAKAINTGVQYSGPPTSARAVGGKASVAQHPAKPVSSGHYHAVRIDNGVQGARLVRLAPEPAWLTAGNLSKTAFIKHHHFAAHMVMFMASVLQQTVKNRPVNATLLCSDARMNRQRVSRICRLALSHR
jgi:hypothetical protein